MTTETIINLDSEFIDKASKLIDLIQDRRSESIYPLDAISQVLCT